MTRIFTYLLLFVGSVSIAQNSFFTPQPFNDNIDSSRIDVPLDEDLYQLNMNALSHYLYSKRTSINQALTILLPNKNGELNEYAIFEDSILEPSFQNKYPNFKSYKGQGITNPAESLRMTITSLGLEVIILNSSDSTQFIKPIEMSRNLYTVYLQKDVIEDHSGFDCELLEIGASVSEDTTQNSVFNANDGLLRDFRIAISATAEYSAFYNSNLSDVVSAMMIAVSHANAVLERDLSVKLTMIDNTSIIFFDPITDPFTNFDNVALIDENQTLIDSTIGDANYDIGHVFNTAGGGIAGLNTSCQPGFKAWGVSGDANPDSQFFRFVFLHELGHQFGSPHVFNGSAGSCGPNISTFTAVEPGSGSTIMAYPGLCFPQNVQNQGDLYYNQISLETMWSHIQFSGGCPANQISTGNNVPTADAGADYLIPQGTPYKLTGSSTDPDGITSHTYTWEQYDFGPAGIPTETTVFGPMVRSFAGTTNPTRYIPRLPDLLLNQGSTEWEKLSFVDRALNFRLTVRDNDPVGGQNAVDAMRANVTTNAGPFVVTSQNLENQIVWTPGNTETITWDVAGTNSNAIDESNVNILLSTDGGLTFDTILASNTPNDGSHQLVVPNLDAPKCRIMVEAVNNIFFNINQEFFAIGDYSYEETCLDFVYNFKELIPENATSVSSFPFQIDESLVITDMNVSLDVSGNADNSSIFFALRPPFDQSGFYELIVYPCPATTGMNLTLDDEGSALFCPDINSGLDVIPTDPLSFADGQNALGNWVLFGGDIFEDGQTSTINSMTVNICSTQPVPNTLSNNLFDTLIDFSIYPNPSSGRINFDFNSTSSQDLVLEVFDITGRSVKRNVYTGQSSTIQNIDVSDLSTGVYLVKVYQGRKTLAKKLIIE